MLVNVRGSMAMHCHRFLFHRFLFSTQFTLDVHLHFGAFTNDVFECVSAAELHFCERSVGALSMEPPSESFNLRDFSAWVGAAYWLSFEYCA